MIATGTVAIGVTGHRDLNDIDLIRTDVDRALGDVCAQWRDRALVLVTSLAEGADRLVARIAIDRYNARLVVVLPLPTTEYEQDFRVDESHREFRELLASAAEIVAALPSPSRDAAYEQAARMILDRSDFLIAIWDGQPSRGRGGTADVVALAHARDVPLIWIRAAHRGSDGIYPAA